MSSTVDIAPFPTRVAPAPRTPIVVRFGRLGDMILLAPMLHCIHQRYGVAPILIGPGPWTAPIYAAHADVSAAWQIENRHRPPALSLEHRRVIAKLRSETGPVYVCETEPRALAKIRQVLKLARIDAARCVFLVDDAPIENEHWADRLLRFSRRTPAAFDALQFPLVDSLPTAPQLTLQDADRRDRDAWLQQRGLRGRRIVLIQAANKRSMRWNGRRAAASDDKFWPDAAWCELLDAIRTTLPDAVVLLCGSPAEARMLRALRAAAGATNIEVAAKDLPLRRLMALMESAHSMVSVDTGPAHLAAALGCPLVVLYGGVSPRHWLQRSATGSAVVSVGGAPEYARADQVAAGMVIAAWKKAIA